MRVTMSRAWAPGSSFGISLGGLSWSLVLLGAGNKCDDRFRPPLPRSTSQPPKQNEKNRGNLYLLPKVPEIGEDEILMAQDAHSPCGPQSWSNPHWPSLPPRNVAIALS